MRDRGSLLRVVIGFAAAATLTLSCGNDDSGAPVDALEPITEPMDVEDLLDRETPGEEPADEQGDLEEALIAPGTSLGPGYVTTRVGGLRVSFELPERIEGGSVAPGEHPVSLELLVDGGAVVVFEAVGHTRDDGRDDPSVHNGIPPDLITWLLTQLPDPVQVVGEPTVLDDGVAVTLENPDTNDTTPVVLWRAEEATEVEVFEGHGPPPGQRQHLWLRELEEGWVGVVTYGQDVEPDIARAIAVSLRPA